MSFTQAHKMIVYPTWSSFWQLLIVIIVLLVPFHHIEVTTTQHSTKPDALAILSA